MSALGFVLSAAQLGLQPVLTKPERRMGPFAGYVTFEESHQDDLEITDHPIEQGASITDHSFKRPAELTMKIGWSDSGTPGGPLLDELIDGVRGLRNTLLLADSALQGKDVGQVVAIYKKVIELQESRVPFDVLTGKRLYRNMLIRSLSTMTDKNTAFTLQLTVMLRQVILVSTTSFNFDTAPPAAQMQPEVTAPLLELGTRQLSPTNAVNSQAAEKALFPYKGIP